MNKESKKLNASASVKPQLKATPKPTTDPKANVQVSISNPSRMESGGENVIFTKEMFIDVPFKVSEPVGHVNEEREEQGHYTIAITAAKSVLT